MRKLILALSAVSIAFLSLGTVAEAASRCKLPEKWNASEGKCEKPAKKPAAMKKAAAKKAA
jgi:hypothetical protein